jgi:AcrR family transcriptional regulator
LSARANRVASTDRAAAVRAALRRLVARRGFHGASMSAVAAEAGVATGTAYVHYRSKDALVLASYLETKQRLGAAATGRMVADDPPEERFRSLWIGAYRHLAAQPQEAQFLLQVDASPYAEAAHAAALARGDDRLLAFAREPDVAKRLLPLPPEVLYEIGVAPAVSLAAREISLGNRQLQVAAAACWRGISRPGM